MDSKTEKPVSKRGRKVVIYLTVLSLITLSFGGIALGVSPTLRAHLGFIYDSGCHRAYTLITENLSPHSIIRTYVDAWDRVQTKLEHLQRIDQENAALRLRNAKLVLQAETTRFEQKTDEGHKLTRQKEISLSHETGDKLGRTMASVSYQVPHHLDHDQLYSLAMGYFQSKENEKAAVIFSFLLAQPNAPKFKTEKNLLMTAIAWYRVDNYVQADAYVTELLKNDEKSEGQTAAQARLWKALISEKMNKKLKAQFWLKELRDRHPHSPEATWINQHRTQAKKVDEAPVEKQVAEKNEPEKHEVEEHHDKH